MKLRDMILTLTETLKKHPEFIDLPIYVHDCRSGAMDSDIGISDSILTQSDYEMGPFDESDIGKPYVAIMVG